MSRQPIKIWAVLALAGLDHLAGATLATEVEHRGSWFGAWTNFANWDAGSSSDPGEAVLCSKELAPGLAWNEAVASWNLQPGTDVGLKVEIRAVYPQGPTKFYTLGWWCRDPSRHPRRSQRAQRDAQGDVLTDTLVLKEPAAVAQLRITVSQPDSVNPGRDPSAAGTARALVACKLIGLSLLNGNFTPGALRPNRRAWGKVVPVPERSQCDYTGGQSAWCSPTSTSMVLTYWARRLGLPGLHYDVPEVVQGVMDPTLEGTGNWPFNAAFAGSLPGMRAYVTRLTDVSELEDWTARGFPVVISVSYDLLRGQRRGQQDDGHLVVCVGFTKKGAVVVNDPGTGHEVRRVFARKDLIAGWANSHNTVYLIYPESAQPPPNRFGHWLE